MAGMCKRGAPSRPCQPAAPPRLRSALRRRFCAAHASQPRIVVNYARSSSASQAEPSADAAFKYGVAALSTVADRVGALSLDTAAELSRIQAERFKTLSNLTVDPVGTLQQLASDVQREPLPTLNFAVYVEDISEEVERRVHSNSIPTNGEDTLTDEERAHVLPDIPPVPEAMVSLQSDIADTRAALKRYAQQQIQQRLV